MDPDWFVPLVRRAHPDVPHDAARAAVTRVWAVLREEAARAGVPAAQADEAAVRRLLGLPGAPEEVAGAARAPAGAGGADPALLATALRVVRAAALAYGG